jgi:hypothetical protein
MEKMEKTMTDQTIVNVDPRLLISQADGALHQARMTLIKAESLHHARRQEEIIAFEDRLRSMDRAHEKQARELREMIDKLEALRG